MSEKKTTKDIGCKQIVGALAFLASLGIAFWIGYGVINKPADKEELPVLGGKQPFEFLYLDSDRVVAYLAQLKDGEDITQRIQEKVTQTKSGEINVQSALKATASTQSEDFVERQVTPTATSIFVDLKDQLRDGEGNELTEDAAFFENFEQQVTAPEAEDDHRFEEGEFVGFKAKIQPPGYLSPYLSVQYRGALGALFPDSGSQRQRRVAWARRDQSHKFGKRIGGNPRVMIAIEKRYGANKESRIKYLIPVRLKQLNDERSLLGSGGTEFIVIGKLVRIFDEPKEGPDNEGEGESQYPYIDSATRVLWKNPLRDAPDELVCRSHRLCVHAARKPRGARRKATKEARQEMLRELKRQTRVERVGAVILPIAIYR